MMCVLGEKKLLEKKMYRSLVGHKAIDIAGSPFFHIRDRELLCAMSKQCIPMDALKQKAGKDLHDDRYLVQTKESAFV